MYIANELNEYAFSAHVSIHGFLIPSWLHLCFYILFIMHLTVVSEHHKISGLDWESSCEHSERMMTFDQQMEESLTD